MKLPDPDDLLLAAEWLDTYDDTHDGGNATQACQGVAQWLRKQVARIDEQDQVQALVRATGATPARARRAYRQILKSADAATAKAAVRVVSR